MPVNPKYTFRILQFMYDIAKPNIDVDFDAVREKFKELDKKEYIDILAYIRDQGFLTMNYPGTYNEQTKTTTVREKLVHDKVRTYLFKQREEQEKLSSDRKWQLLTQIVVALITLFGGFALGWLSRGWTFNL